MQQLTDEDVADEFDDMVITSALAEVTETYASYKAAEILGEDPTVCGDVMYSILDELTPYQLRRAIVMLLADAAAERVMPVLTGVRACGGE